MDASHAAGASSKASADSASASNSPSEDALSTSAGHSRGSGDFRGPAELSGALGSFLKRASGLEDHPGASRFSSMFRDMKSDDPGRQIMALTELSEYLSFSSEEALISFPMETFIPVLIGLLEDPGHGDETAAQAMLLCCRCLFNVVDILPPTTRIITAAGGLPVLCANLLNVAYIDVAELAVAIIERISEDQPLQVLKAGGLQAILMFLDFFQIAVQRQAANAAALMLLPIPPADVFDQHVRAVLPTLAQLLQHQDPQVLQSICECWRRVLDSAIIIHGRSRPRSGSGSSQPHGKMSAKGKVARWPGDRSKKDKEEPTDSGASGTNAPTGNLAAVLEEMCPGSVLSHLLMLLSNGISSPSPHTSVVMSEVLYILAVLTNFSDTFTKDVLNQDICSLLRQMVLVMDVSHGGPASAGSSSSQTSFALLRVLAAVASILPAVRFSDSGCSCECEEKRLALFQENPEYIETLVGAFLPALVDIHEASTDPCVQSLCITLMLTFFLTCRDRPESIKRSLDPTRLACFLANMLLADSAAGASKSVTLACLLIVYELLDRHPEPYSLLFVRHGVVRAIHGLVTRGAGDENRRSNKASGKAQEPKAKASKFSAAASPQARPRSKNSLIEEAAHRVLSSYFATSSHTGESHILKALGKIAKQLRSSPTAVIEAHREALSKLHDLLLTPESITAFEFARSGTASALNAFLYPIPASGISDAGIAYGDRLRLFLDCIGNTASGAFVKLIRLCVSAVQRSEQQPLTLFPTHASLMTALPPHLRLMPPQVQAGGKGEGRSGFSFDLPPAMASRIGGRGMEAGGGASTSLSVLKLLAKPVRVRLAPSGALGTPSSSSSNALPNFRALLTPFSAKASPPRLLEGKASSAAAAAATAALAAKALPSELSASAAASPAARLRNYLASKVTRKRPNSSAAAAAAPADKKSTVSGLLAKAGRANQPPVFQPNPSPAEEPMVGASAWDPEEGGSRSFEGAAAAAATGWETASGSSARGLAGPGEDAPTPSSRARDREREMVEEAVEVILLLDPLAPVGALEDYIWERHSQALARHMGPSDASLGAAAVGASASPALPPLGPLGNGEGSAAAASASAPAEGADASGTGGASSGSSESGSARGPGAGAAAAAEDAAMSGRVRLLAARDRAHSSTPPMGNSPRTPVATIACTPDSGGLGPPDAMLPPAQASESEAAQSDSEHVGEDMSIPSFLTRVARTPPGAQGLAGLHAPKQKRVQIFLNGHQLTARTSIVQALVSHTTRLPRARPVVPHEDTIQRPVPDRFLVSAEDDSGSEAEASAEGPTLNTHTSSRLFCGMIWGRVHAMTYELVDDTSTPREADRPNSSRDGQPLSSIVVSTDFDSLVQQHKRIITSIQALQVGFSAAAASSTAAAALGDTETAELTSPRSGDSKDDGAVDSTPGAAGSRSIPGDPEALAMLLQLICSLHNICEYIRNCQGPMVDVKSSAGLAESDDFHCRSLTSKLLRQLSDPLAICTGSIPTWCTKLSGTCRFLFPNSARRILHHSCNLGLSRALHHVQQRTLAQNAHSQEMQRRLEGEVVVANIPRQKVRISRQRILESAIKVMNLYGSGNTILEVEYVGEVGTGSGPTLEFYAQVAEIMRTSEPRLFRQGVPGGMLFPEPYDTGSLQPGQEQASSTVLDRFRLLGQVVAKCILDNRLVDIQIHPFFWRTVLGNGPFSHRSLRDVDPELYKNLEEMRSMDEETIASLCVDFTLPAHPKIELKPGGAGINLTSATVDEYISRVVEVSLVTSIAPQAAAFSASFSEILSLETCRIWSETELASLIMGSSVYDDAFWTTEHLASHIKAQHGYNADSRCFRDLLGEMSKFTPATRRSFLTFVTGAPSLPINGFGGLKPPLTVVKKESPPPPLTPDQFMPSVMTCANYLKLPEYTQSEILRQKLDMAMLEGQSAFLLS